MFLYPTSAQLDAYRLQGDRAADAFIESHRPLWQGQVPQLMEWLSGPAQSPVPEALAEAFAGFRAVQDFPVWMEEKRVLRACRFFQEHEKDILLLLGTLSLPYCYAAADGVKVLHFSQRLHQDAFRRLQETARFVRFVNKAAHWQKPELLQGYILKIRLFHAFIRFKLRHTATWNSAWGLAVNQEDMAGTNLSFSYIVLRGLRRLGYQASPQEAADYLHLWNVIGCLLGVEETLLPHSLKEAFYLDKMIAQRQFRESTEGQLLTKALLEVFATQAPSQLYYEILVATMHQVLGRELCTLLQVPESFSQKALGQLIRLRSGWQHFWA
jgi:hypothetical protein